MHTIRSRPPLSSSFNQSSCLFDDKFAQNPLLLSSSLSPKFSCSCCRSCYANNISMCDRFSAVNPSFSRKGLSQSTLIQSSLCKRLIFRGRIRQSYGYASGFSSFDDLDESYCYEKLHDVKNMIDDYVNDVEVMFGLLTGEVGLKYTDVKNRKRSNKEKRNVGLKCDEIVKMKFLKKSENLDLRTEGYFGELEGRKDFEGKSDGCYVGQTSSSAYKNDLRKDCNGYIDEVVGKIEKQEESVQELEGLLGKDTANGYDGETVGVSHDWRKKSEKKLNKELSQHESNTVVNMEPCEQHSHGILETIDKSDSMMKYKRFISMSDKDKSVIESTSTTKNKLKVIPEVPKLQDVHMGGTSSLPESRIRSFEEKSADINTQIVDNREEKRQKEEQYMQQMLGISGTSWTSCENTSVSPIKSNIRMEKQRGYDETLSSKAMVIESSRIEDSKDDGLGTSGQKGCGSRHSSKGSGPKGPSDEMWHVTDTSTQEPSEPDNNTFGSSEKGEPVKTSGRSLWTMIGDLVRLHWKSPRSGSHTPTSNGAKGSSYMSTTSETWFSSDKPYDSNDENVRKRIIKGLDSPLTEGPSRNTSLLMVKESCFALKRSPENKKMVKTDPNHSTELKSRKLVHKDQVFEDNFDEWEEAHNLKNKQQKEDEMFMREALLEAKKAADAWEVPVGAILVKNGKIIACGYNMVEMLQDSTAHAEMICIRKASTAITSWRLSPCPMCAGAILQARIHTVVWGAPNRLLGADGSWIRLFCDGDGGNSSMPPAPTHPFHPNMVVRRGVLAAECAEVMQHFFQLRRKKKAEPQPPNLPSSISVSHHHRRHHSKFLSKIRNAFNIIFCL